MKKVLLSSIILFFGKILFSQNIDTVKFARWINENSIELKGSGFNQLAEKLSDKTIIGLGECLHGSKTIDNMRFDVAKALIENSDFNIVAFEMPFNIGLQINHFLQTGDGDIEQILQQSHPFTRTTEMVDFIKWIKDFEGEKSKIILFAHNAHLGKSLRLSPRVRTLSAQGFYEDWGGEFATGHYLNEFFDEYYFIGTQFGNGFFMGFDPENDFRFSKLEVTSPEPYSLPHLLQQASKFPYFIDLRSPKAETWQIVNYLRSFQSFYHIGAAYDFKYSKARLIDYFDAIIYIDKIEESNRFEFEQK